VAETAADLLIDRLIGGGSMRSSGCPAMGSTESWRRSASAETTSALSMFATKNPPLSCLAPTQNTRQVPIGVVVPKTERDVIETIAVCREFFRASSFPGRRHKSGGPVL